MTLPSILTGVVSISDSVKRIGSYTGFCGMRAIPSAYFCNRLQVASDPLTKAMTSGTFTCSAMDI